MISVKLNIQWHQPERIWLLSFGGRVPTVFAQIPMLYCDRNVLSRLRAIARRPASPASVADAWWLGHLDNAANRINPVLCALEGARRRRPALDEYTAAARSAVDCLRGFFKAAQVLEYDADQTQASFELLEALATRRDAEVAFLQGAVPLVLHRVSRRQEGRVRDQVLALAAAHSVPATSMAVLATLSVLYERQDGAEPRIGRGIIKPNPDFGKQDAYNAVADLQSLEFLIMACAVSGGKAGLVTADRSLLNFWLTLKVDDVAIHEGEMRWRITPERDLFPRLSDEARIALVEHLGERAS